MMSIFEKAVVQMMNYGMSRTKAEEIVNKVLEEYRDSAEAIPVEWIMKHAEETESIGLPNMAEAFRAMVTVWRDRDGKDMQ